MARTSIATHAFTDADNTAVMDLDSGNTFQEQDGVNGRLRVFSNSYRGNVSGAQSHCVYKGTGTFTADQYAKAKIVGSFNSSDGDNIGVTVRSTGTSPSNLNCYAAAYWPSVGAIRVYKVVNGTHTQMGADMSATPSYGTDTIEVEAVTNGSNVDVKAYLSGSLLGTRTDSTSPHTTGKPGITGLYSVGNTRGDDLDIGNVTADAPTVTNADDEAFYDGETSVTITGTAFGASQGAGAVYFSPSNSIADSGKVAQTVTAWSNTSITITVVRSSLSLETNLYLFVKDNAGNSNVSGYVVQIQARVYLRESFINLQGVPQASISSVILLVWHAAPSTGSPNPNQALSVALDGTGAINQQLNRGSLALNAAVWVAMFKDGGTPIGTARKVTTSDGLVYE